MQPVFAPVIIVPVKPLAAAKTRLRTALDDRAREALVLAMLADTLAAVREAHEGAVLLVSDDRAYAPLAKQFGATRLADGASGYNEAMAVALASAAVVATGAALIVPADLPRALPSELRRAIEALSEAEVVVAPAFDGGTAVLGLRPPSAIKTAFGLQSAQAHLRAATEAQRSAIVLDLPSLSYDIDNIEDLLVMRDTLGAATQAFVRQYGARWEEELVRGRD